VVGSIQISGKNQIATEAIRIAHVLASRPDFNSNSTGAASEFIFFFFLSASIRNYSDI
jgi:hypothetical protein